MLKKFIKSSATSSKQLPLLLKHFNYEDSNSTSVTLAVSLIELIVISVPKTRWWSLKKCGHRDTAEYCKLSPVFLQFLFCNRNASNATEGLRLESTDKLIQRPSYDPSHLVLAKDSNGALLWCSDVWLFQFQCWNTTCTPTEWENCSSQSHPELIVSSNTAEAAQYKLIIWPSDGWKSMKPVVHLVLWNICLFCVMTPPPISNFGYKSSNIFFFFYCS